MDMALTELYQLLALLVGPSAWGITRLEARLQLLPVVKTFSTIPTVMTRIRSTRLISLSASIELITKSSEPAKNSTELQQIFNRWLRGKTSYSPLQASSSLACSPAAGTLPRQSVTWVRSRASWSRREESWRSDQILTCAMPTRCSRSWTRVRGVLTVTICMRQWWGIWSSRSPRMKYS